MEKDYFIEDDKLEILPPYWWVEYIDDWGAKHIATTKNKGYLTYLEANFRIVEKKVVQA